MRSNAGRTETLPVFQESLLLGPAEEVALGAEVVQEIEEKVEEEEGGGENGACRVMPSSDSDPLTPRIVMEACICVQLSMVAAPTHSPTLTHPTLTHPTLTGSPHSQHNITQPRQRQHTENETVLSPYLLTASFVPRLCFSI